MTHSPHRKTGYLCLTATIAIWSTSPFVVTRFSQTVHPIAAASLVVWIALFANFMIAWLRGIPVYRHVKERLKDWATLKRLTLMAVLAYFIYPIAYFSAIGSPFPIQANISNYGWPMIATVGSMIIARRKPTLERSLGVLLAVGGILVNGLSIQSDPNATALPISNHSKQLWTHPVSVIIVGALAAISYGVYSALGAIQSKHQENGNEHQSDFITMLLIASVLHCIVMSVSVFAGGTTPTLMPQGMPYLILYGCVHLSIAHLLWLTAIRCLSRDGEDASFAAVAIYMTPMISTAILWLFSVGSLPDSTFAGLSLVMCGIYLSHYRVTYIPPLPASLLTIAIIATLTFVIPRFILPVPVSLDAQSWSIADMLTSVFAIISGFILNRAITVHRESNTLFLRLIGHLRTSENGDPARLLLREKNLINQYLLLGTDFMRRDSPEGGNKAICEPDSPREFNDTYSNWRIVHLEKVSWYEQVILFGMFLVLAMVMLTLSPQSVAVNFGRIFFLATIALVCVAIRDFNSPTSSLSVDFILDLQQGTSHCYLPAEIAAIPAVRSKLWWRGYKVVTFTGDGSFVPVAVDASDFYSTAVPYIFLTLAFLCNLYTLVR